MKKRLIIIAGLLIVVLSVLAVLFRAAYVIPVLMYHSIDYNDKVTKLSVSPESFARQMEFLHKHKYNVVTLDKITSYLEKKEKVPPKTVAITFDDGYDNNYKYVYPVLKKYNLPGAIFIIVNNVGKPGYLTWPQIKEMSDSGVITIGSHTMKHLWLPDVGTNVMESEIRRSKEILEEKTGKPIKYFCYPVGAHDRKVEDAVAGAGYSCAVATNPGKLQPNNDIYAIKRIKISRTSDSLFVFWFETSGLYTWVKERNDE